jgi:hypothetical protein
MRPADDGSEIWDDDWPGFSRAFGFGEDIP